MNWRLGFLCANPRVGSLRVEVNSGIEMPKVMELLKQCYSRGHGNPFGFPERWYVCWVEEVAGEKAQVVDAVWQQQHLTSPLHGGCASWLLLWVLVQRKSQKFPE